MTDLPGGIKLLLILVFEIIKTIKVLCALEGFLDILDNLGSDATPMTPGAVVGTVRLQMCIGHDRR